MGGPDHGSAAYKTNIVFAARQCLNQEFFIDSGTTLHIVNDKSQFSSIYEIEERTVHGAEVGSAFKAVAKGTVNLHTMFGGQFFHITLKDALYCPDAVTNLVSVMRLDRDGLKITFGDLQAVRRTKGGTSSRSQQKPATNFTN